MTIAVTKAVVVGATGPTGVHLIDELQRRGIATRAVSRSSRHLAEMFPSKSVETRTADALDAEAIARAVEGCDLVVDAIGLPAERMAEHETTARAVAEAGRAAGARLMQISSFWSYLPISSLPVDESHPRQGGNGYIQARRAAEDAMTDAGAAVVQLPDFFGPKVHTSTLQQALREAAHGGAVHWIGGEEVEREYCYVPDAMRTAADLAVREEAYGKRWIVPGNGVVSGRQVAEIAGRHLGREVKLRPAGPAMLRLISLFLTDLRRFLPMVPHYAVPIRFDTSRLADLIGPQVRTPMADAIGVTLDWLRE